LFPGEDRDRSEGQLAQKQRKVVTVGCNVRCVGSAAGTPGRGALSAATRQTGEVAWFGHAQRGCE
jgi:hypothetical protein